MRDHLLQNCSFSRALDALKDGYDITRSGWNGKGMYLYLHADDESFFEPVIVMFTADQKHQPGWLASQADLLASDWIVLYGKQN